MAIGRVAGPFGLRGEMKVDLLTDFPERFSSLVQVHVGPDYSPYAIECSRKHAHQVVLKLKDVDTPEAVKELGGLELHISREEAVPLPEGHYFLDELIGVNVETESGKQLGPIRDVLRTGSNDVYVVGSGREEILIPGTSEAVRDLDLDGRRMVVESWILDSDESR